MPSSAPKPVTLPLVRENAEAVAFMRGEDAERGRFRASFGEIIRNWRGIMNTEFRLECFSASYLKITNLIPIFASCRCICRAR